MIIFNLSKILSNKNEYDNIKQEAYSNMKRNSKYEVTFIFDGVTTKLPLNKFFIMMVMLRPFVDLKIIHFNRKYLFITDKISESIINDYFTSLINLFVIELGVDPDKIKKPIKETMEELSDISGEANVQKGLTINLYDLVQLSNKNETITSFFNYKIISKEFNVIDEEIKENGLKFINLLKNNNTCLSPYLNTKTGINLKQLLQVFFTIGLKPTIKEKIFNHIINTSFVNGLRNKNDFYGVALGCRKALIIINKNVKMSGYLTRKLSLLTIDTNLDNSVNFCKTKNTLTYFVKDVKRLDNIVGRYYFNKDKITIITKNSKNIIGKTINMFSPITCAGEHGICSTCYGSMAKINKDIHVGLIAVLYLTEKMTQMLLSAKHLLQTNIQKPVFPDWFIKYFYIDGECIKIIDNEKYQLIINKNNIELNEETNRFSITHFNIMDNKVVYSFNPAEIEMNNKHGFKFFLNQPLVKLVEEGETEDEKDIDVITTNLSEYAMDTSLFEICYENNALSAPLKNILNIIENNRELKKYNIHTLNEKFISSIEQNFSVGNVHIEILLRELVRDCDNVYNRPNFSNVITDEQYRILRVSDAIHRSSIVKSLSFERIKNKLSDIDNYNEINHNTILDEILN